jgi:hypothetical protein
MSDFSSRKNDYLVDIDKECQNYQTGTSHELQKIFVGFAPFLNSA